LIAVLVGAAACGPRPPAPGVSGTPTPSPAASASPQVTSEYPGAKVLVDPKGAITLQPGDEVVIELSTESGFEPWGPLRTPDLNVIAPLYPPVAQAGRSGRTALVALGPGSAKLE